MLPRLLWLARAPVELAEAEVAVGDEGAHAELFGEQTFYLAGADLTASALKARIARLPGGRQYFIQIYPSYAVRLARGLLTEGLELAVYPKAVIGVTETMTAANAALIGSAFRCQVVNHYSAWEVLHIAQSCPDSPESLHVNSERAILRVVRDDGSSAPPGERVLPGALERLLTFVCQIVPYVWEY